MFLTIFQKAKRLLIKDHIGKWTAKLPMRLESKSHHCQNEKVYDKNEFGFLEYKAT